VTVTSRPQFAVDHVGVVVPDLDQAVAFYRTGFGMTVESEEQPTAVSSQAIGLPGQSVGLQGAILRHGDARIEFHQFLTPAVTGRRSANDFGPGHLAFAVGSIDEAAAYLEEYGVVWNSEPLLIESGALAGRRWVYGRDPSGTVIELCKHPVGRDGGH